MKLKFDFTPKEFEKAKETLFEEAMSAGTLGDYDVDTNTLTYSLIPFIIYAEISLGAERKRRLAGAVFEFDISGKSGNVIHIPICDRDEYTAQKISESTLDNDGYTKTKMSPSSVALTVGDIVYVATRISDVLQEDQPEIGWIRAMLQKCGEAVVKQIESDIEGDLYTYSNDTNAVVAGAGSLTHALVAKAVQELEEAGFIEDEKILFVNPASLYDLKTEASASFPMTLERAKIGDVEGFAGYSGVDLIVVSDQVRANFAYAMVAPSDISKASLGFGWKRPIKIERDRDSQYGRDKFFVTARYAHGKIRTDSIVMLSNC